MNTLSPVNVPVNVNDLRIEANVCNQLLRVLEATELWSLAHVAMNPGAASLLHRHEKMEEIYVFTKGTGVLMLGDRNVRCYNVQAGHIIHIPAGIPHMMQNNGATSLEHLVLASPPFDPTDVQLIERDKRYVPIWHIPTMNPYVESIEGARVMPYQFASIQTSMAFGHVTRGLAHKRHHYHKETTEWLFIVEGVGSVILDDQEISVREGDWIQISPDTCHSIRTHSRGDMVVLCICTPCFDMVDVHFE